MPRYLIALAELMDLLANDDNEGVCVACGDLMDNCEPDAQRYPCDGCGKKTVYGTQEVLIRGWYTEEERS